MTYAPVEAVAVPDGAAAPPAPPAGTLTGEPGLGGSLPDGEADPDPDPLLDGELEPGEPDEPELPLDGEPDEPGLALDGDPEEPELPLDGEPEEPELPLDGDPDEPELPLDGEPELEPELGEPVEPTAAAVGVAVTVL